MRAREREDRKRDGERGRMREIAREIEGGRGGKGR